MTHPLVYMLVHRPQMLVLHAQAYADLLGADAALAMRQVRLKVALGLMSLCMLAIALMLTGVAVMLWGVLPLAPMDWPWVMLAVPGVGWLLALGLAWASYLVPVGNTLANFKGQIDADMALCKELNVS